MNHVIYKVLHVTSIDSRSTIFVVLPAEVSFVGNTQN
jgi:hypothetical protein